MRETIIGTDKQLHNSLDTRDQMDPISITVRSIALVSTRGNYYYSKGMRDRCASQMQRERERERDHPIMTKLIK